MKPVLSCHDLERHLGEGDTRLQVLRSVSLDLKPGDVHAVVGPSGCGKSTLLYLLGLLDTPDSGKIMLQDENVAHLDENARSARRNACLGFIFQFHFLLQDFTALENVTIPMRRLGRLSDEEMTERARYLLSIVGLERKTHRMSRQLSGGEQQRVAIARALANDPPVILADEPTGNLDSENSERVFDLLMNLARDQQKAILLVTHNPLIADRCDWVHEMKDGEIIRSKARA